jgi:hypothetical protein
MLSGAILTTVVENIAFNHYKNYSSDYSLGPLFKKVVFEKANYGQVTFLLGFLTVC